MWKNNTYKVLIIQDSIQSINTLRNSLKGDDFQVISCNGDQGFFCSMEEEPDVILLDILLNNRQGYQLLKELKNHWNIKHIPVLVASLINLQEYWDEAFRLGASGYLVIGQHQQYLAARVQKIVQFQEALAS